MVVTIVNHRNEKICERTANLIKGTEYYTIGQDVSQTYKITKYRYLLDDNYNFIRVNAQYHISEVSVIADVIIPHFMVKNSFLYYKDDDKNNYKNNLFLFTNDNEYVYIFNTNRKTLKSNLEIITTPRLRRAELMFKPSIKKCMSTFTIYRKLPIRFVAMMLNKCLSDTLTENEFNKLVLMSESKDFNTGNLIEYFVEQNKDYLFNIGSEMNKFKDYDVIPNNKYINFSDFKNYVNKDADGIEIKACFDSTFTELLTIKTRKKTTAGKSTGHGYVVPVIDKYLNDNKYTV